MAGESAEAPARVGGVSGSSGPSSGIWVPQPDPTTLTTAIVDTAKADLRRELASLRELLETRITALEESVGEVSLQSSSRRDDVREVLTTLHAEIDRRLIGIGQNEQSIRAEIRSEIEHLENLFGERFTAITQQFTERDVRGEQEKKSSKEALDAALLAQKESVSQQNDANTTAATKSETSFTKQIDQIGTLIATLEKSLTDRITELKERIDRGEGGSAGVRQSEMDRRGGITTNTAILMAVFAFITVLVVIAVATHGFTK